MIIAACSQVEQFAWAWNDRSIPYRYSPSGGTILGSQSPKSPIRTSHLKPVARRQLPLGEHVKLPGYNRPQNISEQSCKNIEKSQGFKNLQNISRCFRMFENVWNMVKGCEGMWRAWKKHTKTNIYKIIQTRKNCQKQTVCSSHRFITFHLQYITILYTMFPYVSNIFQPTFSNTNQKIPKTSKNNQQSPRTSGNIWKWSQTIPNQFKPVSNEEPGSL